MANAYSSRSQKGVLVGLLATCLIEGRIVLGSQTKLPGKNRLERLFRWQRMGEKVVLHETQAQM